MPEQYRVRAPQLNLRSRPLVSKTNRLALLPQGQIVFKLTNDSQLSWWKVSTTLNDAPLTGYVHHAYLEPLAPETNDHVAVSTIMAVHMPENRPASRRSSTGSRAYPLGETDSPRRITLSPQTRVDSLNQIIAWLDVERSPRYLPDGRNTFCNIYAYDYCYLAGAYLPRVWWSSKAASLLSQGKPVEPRYGDTLYEQTANMLFNWLLEYGADFGWRREFDPDTLQNQVNRGAVGIICGQTDGSVSGHIVAVVPETGHWTAQRSNGRVSVPLQSQAGRVNNAYFSSRWWTRTIFRNHGFWVHE
jgi:hypothetical protein